MVICENVIAAAYAFPRDPMPVADRRMSLTIQCHEAADYRSNLLGVGMGRGRLGAQPRDFSLCDNHRRLYEQIDLELVEEAWSPSHTAKPVSLT